MRKKTYLSFKDLRAFYDSDTKKLRLTSGDPRLASQRWGLTLDRDTHDKAVIERELTAAGLAPERDLSSHREERVLAGSPTIGNRIVLGADGFEHGSLGPYIGRTTDGTDEGVFYSPLVDLNENRVPLCLLSGQPGSGKSFAALRIVDGVLHQGATVGQLDPRGDFVRYAAQWGEGHVRDLRNQPAGLLNPFAFEIKGQRYEVALTTLKTLLGGNVSLSATQSALLARAVAEAVEQVNPSLSTVLDYLSELGDEARALVDNLRLMRELPFARLIFESEKSETGLTLAPGLNLVTMMGLDLPWSELAPNAYSNSNRLGVAIYHLAHLHLRRTLGELPNAIPKLLVAEEAWLLTGTQTGKRELQQSLSEAPARQLATLLIAQDPADFNLVEAPATRMFFRQPGQRADVSCLTQHDHDPEWRDEQWVRTRLSSLHNGECVMEDGRGNRATVQISAGSQRLRDAFATDYQARRGGGGGWLS